MEALVDHMVPADELTPKGTDIGINIYIDRALAGAWGKGDRLYMQGPWKTGVPSQGYQLPLTPAQLYRAGIAATNAHCRKTYGKAFDRLDEKQREEVLVGLSTGKVTFDERAAGAGVLDHGLSDRDGGHVLRPDLRRQPRQGGLEDDRLPRRDRGQSRERREISRQAVPDQSARHRGHELREDDMATKLKEVDVVVVGLGWTGGILSKELAEAGLKVVALERGAMRTTGDDYSLPNIRDELRYVVRHDLMMNTARDTLTIRNNPSQEALPMRRLGSFLPGEGVGGSGVHWSGHTWRWTDMEFKVRSLYEERYGKSFIPADMTIQDWGITYDELEPYYDRFEYTAAVSGKAGNLRGQIQPGGNPFEAPRARDYRAAAADHDPGERDVRPGGAGTTAIIRSRGRPPTRRAPTPIRTARNSAPASIAAIASASAARPTPRAARTWR